jgi:hypothetical protein
MSAFFKSIFATTVIAIMLDCNCVYAQRQWDVMGIMLDGGQFNADKVVADIFSKKAKFEIFMGYNDINKFFKIGFNAIDISDNSRDEISLAYSSKEIGRVVGTVRKISFKRNAPMLDSLKESLINKYGKPFVDPVEPIQGFMHIAWIDNVPEEFVARIIADGGLFDMVTDVSKGSYEKYLTKAFPTYYSGKLIFANLKTNNLKFVDEVSYCMVDIDSVRESVTQYSKWEQEKKARELERAKTSQIMPKL